VRPSNRLSGLHYASVPVAFIGCPDFSLILPPLFIPGFNRGHVSHTYLVVDFIMIHPSPRFLYRLFPPRCWFFSLSSAEVLAHLYPDTPSIAALFTLKPLFFIVKSEIAQDDLSLRTPSADGSFQGEVLVCIHPSPFFFDTNRLRNFLRQRFSPLSSSRGKQSRHNPPPSV